MKQSSIPPCPKCRRDFLTKMEETTHVCATVDVLRAENAQLKSDWNQAARFWIADRLKYEAEIRALREALKAIGHRVAGSGIEFVVYDALGEDEEGRPWPYQK